MRATLPLRLATRAILRELRARYQKSCQTLSGWRWIRCLTEASCSDEDLSHLGCQSFQRAVYLSQPSWHSFRVGDGKLGLDPRPDLMLAILALITPTTFGPIPIGGTTSGCMA